MSFQLNCCPHNGINTVLLAAAALAAILGIGTFIFRPRVRRATETPEIPKLQEIKEQQLQAKYNVIQEEAVQEHYTGRNDHTQYDQHLLRRTKGICCRHRQRISFSREHRADIIPWRSSQYKIYDTSSTGSYMNGQEEPLPQNMEVWLGTGVTLDIGDSTNRFSLE